MNCPHCNTKTTVIETRHDDTEGTTYRQRQCKVCGSYVYTKEQEVAVDMNFIRKWDDISRWKKRKKK